MLSNLKLFIGACAVVGAVAGYWFYKTQTAWVESGSYTKPTNEPAKTLVVTYSRTGNTEAAAKVAAKYFDADLLTIQAPNYPNDLKGLKRASDEAGAEVVSTPIIHNPVDLSEYELVVLASPTWWFRPAVPLWSFVHNHDFQNTKVFLMMTGNSRYKESMIEKFEGLVESQNGHYLDMLFIQRGRIYWQKTKQEVSGEVLEALESREPQWQEILYRS